VYGFPILIRLTSNTFDFTQAKTDGADIRFTSSDGKPLPYEIDHWDAVKKNAQIWVKADTVFGNVSTQSITMYWGYSTAADSSTSTAVFDTAEGFQGVWHLGDEWGDSFHDATLNQYYGISPDSARPQIADGTIGTCNVFNGSGDFITMPGTANSKLNFPENSFFTVSAWAMLNSFDNTSHLIVSKGYEQYYLRLGYLPSYSPLWEFAQFSESTDWQTSSYPATSKQWVLITGVRRGSRQYLYCNDILVDSLSQAWPNPTATRNTTNDLSIGGFLQQVTNPEYEGYCYFNGAIDEVRILSTAQSADWVRLCYMNQRPDDRLVVFR
jgi:hypothetical protein